MYVLWSCPLLLNKYLATAALWVRLSQKYKMGDIGKGVANTQNMYKEKVLKYSQF